MIKRFIQARYRSYTPDGKFWLTVGALVLTVDMAIAYCAGATVTIWHGLGFAGCALAFAFMPDAAYEEYENKRYLAAGALALLCLPIGLQAYQQQLTYSAGMRTGDIQQTRVQNVKHAGAQENIVETKANYELWSKMLNDLQAQAPWAATVKADALRGEVKTLTERLALETKGQRGRKAGCGAECERLQNAITETDKKIATAERMDDLSKKIEAAKTVLATARDKADKTEYKSSVIANVANVNAQLVKLLRGASAKDSMELDEIAMNYANVASAGLGSLALLILAPIAFFLAGRRRHIMPGGSEPFHTMHSPSFDPPGAHQVHQAPAHAGSHTIVERPTIIQDTKVAATLARLAQFRQQKAA